MTWTDDIEDVLRYSVHYPVRDVRALLLGGMVLFLGGIGFLGLLSATVLELHAAIQVAALFVCAVSLVAVTGYVVRVTRSAASGDEVLPGFTAGVVREGSVYFLVLLPWLAAVGVAALAPATLFVVGMGEWIGWVLAFLFAAAVVLVWVYVFPAVTLVYCVQGWRAAYGRGVWRVSVDPTYVAVSLAYHAVASLAVLALAVSVVSVVVWAWLSFYFLVFSGAFWGRSYRRIED